MIVDNLTAETNNNLSSNALTTDDAQLMKYTVALAAN